MQNENLVGSDTNGVSVPVADYQQQQYGFSLGGPIVRDRLHFFVTGDFRHDNRPFATSIQLGANGDTTGVGITQQRFDSVTAILKDSFGISAGDWRAPQINNPETNLFAKLDLELSTNSHLEMSGTLINVNQDKMIHTYRSGFIQPPSLSNARRVRAVRERVLHEGRNPHAARQVDHDVREQFVQRADRRTDHDLR